MNHKVLLADDSLTIQKVIKITLANQKFDIFDCTTDEDLLKMLPEIRPELVFLDFNLSEKYTGYELTSKIKSILPTTQVLLLLGTFDTVNDEAMSKCGAADKIVKPFDSNKFISICNRLVDSGQVDEKLVYPNVESEDDEIQGPEDSVEEDHWQINHRVQVNEVPQEDTGKTKRFDAHKYLNPLDQEVSDWGMSVPNVIDDTRPHDKVIDLPPVINESKLFQENDTKGGAKFPLGDDLDYPIDDESKPIVPETVSNAANTLSKLVSIDSLNLEQEIDFQIEHSINSVPETDVSSIKEQIRDEVEADLWKVDEFEDLKKEVSKKIEEVSPNFGPMKTEFDDYENEENQWVKTTNNNESNISREQIIQDLRAEVDDLVKKHVKEYMDQMFKNNVEKISWEVIPDLAENMIRQEISKISNKILNE